MTLIAAAIATLEPEIAPNSTHASTVATPKPPGIQPTSAVGEAEQLRDQAGALHEEAGEDEQRDRHQRVARDEAEERAEDDVRLEQRVDHDVGRRRAR